MFIYRFFVWKGEVNMKILRKMRVLSLLVAISIIAGQFGIVSVNAAQGVEQAPVGTELSGFRITDLDRPVPGKPLDFKARVRTNENVTWEIPVIWTDENGNTVYEALPGHTYYPNFAFYIPDGYRISAKAALQKMLVRIPDFLAEEYGESSVLFASDAGLGITYITFVQAVQAQAAKVRQDEFRPAPAPINVPYTDSNQSGSSSDSTESKPAPAPIVPISNILRVHCSQDVIDKYRNSLGVLEELVSLIKNKLEPQAVNLLKNGFSTCFNTTENALGKELGLYIYNKSGIVDDHITMPGAIAYVDGDYFDMDGEVIYKYIMGIDTDSFMEEYEPGKWKYKDGMTVDRDNTIVHELMHAFMDDYTRRGMMEGYVGADGFPLWFIEGIAGSVENTYQYRTYSLQSMGRADDPDSYNYQLGRYTARVEYSAASVRDRYGYNPENYPAYRYDLRYSDDENNHTSAYVSGYLAVVYLGYLAAIHEGACTATETSVDTAAIRDGLGHILNFIHAGWSLDSVIRYISTPNSDPTDPDSFAADDAHFKSTLDFEEKFIKGNDEGSASIFTVGMTTVGAQQSGGRDVLGSAQFVATYLNYLESKSNHGDGDDHSALANGSLLSSDIEGASYYITDLTPLNETDTPDPGLYKIPDKPGFVASTVDNETAYDNTGGRTKSSGESNEEAAASGTQAAAAANTEPVSGEGFAEGSSQEPAQSAENHTTSDSFESSDTADPAPTPEEVPAIPPAPAEPVIDIGIPEAGIDAGVELVIVPTEQDAITPDEVVPESGEVSFDAPAPDDSSSDCGSSSDGGSSDGGDDSGSDDGGSDDGGSDEGSSDGGSEE